MPIVNKTKRTAAIYNRGREVVKVYDHGTLAWQKQTSIPDYLCFTALEAGQFTLTIPAAVTATYLSYVEWSKDGRTWNHTDNTSEAVTIDVQVASGDKVYWRGSGVCMNDSIHAQINYCSVFTQTEETPNFVVSGNLVSLIALSDFDYEVTRACAFANLFNGNEKLTDAETLILPMFGAAATYLFYMTFKNCSNLAKAPILNLTRTTSNCCFEMFRGTALTTMPELPDIALSNYCYSGMFRETNIEKAVLPSSATTLVTSCYSNIFSGCTHLKYVKCLATDISATNCITNWLNGVSSTGTFIQAEGVEWPRGASGIPTGWVDVEKRTMPSGYKQVLGIYGNGIANANINIGYAVNMKYDKIEVAFKQDEISNGMVLQSVPASGSANNGKCWFYNYNGSSLASKPFAIYSQKADGTQVLMTAGQIYQPLDTNPHYIEYTADGTNLTVIHNGTTKTSTRYVSDLPETCAADTRLFGSTVPYRGKIFYFRNSNGNTQLADYVACVRESDNAPGFWDFVSNSFQTSSDPTKFTAGEEI